MEKKRNERKRKRMSEGEKTRKAEKAKENKKLLKEGCGEKEQNKVCSLYRVMVLHSGCSFARKRMP